VQVAPDGELAAALASAAQQSLPLHMSAELASDPARAGSVVASPQAAQLMQALETTLPAVSAAVAAAASAAWAAVLTPLRIFGDEWLLNLLFLGSAGLLTFALLIKAPKQ
jgi:hypothetical protein